MSLYFVEKINNMILRTIVRTEKLWVYALNLICAFSKNLAKSAHFGWKFEKKVFENR